MRRIYDSWEARLRPFCRLFATLAVITCASPATSALPTPATSPGVGVISDTDGAIEEITLHYNHNMAEELTPLYLDLFSFLASDIHVKVLCRNVEEMNIFLGAWSGLITSSGRTLEVINIESDLSIWARDRRIARQSLDLAVIAESFVPVGDDNYEESKFNEIDAYFVLATAGLTPPVLDTALQVEGGNVVSNHRYTFVGANVVEENSDIPWASEMVFTHLTGIVGRPIITVRANDGNVPWCHVDMYLTPINDRVLLVADMNLGLRLLGETDFTNSLSTEEEKVDALLNTSGLVPDQLDEVADQMRHRGFVVVRLPALADPSGEWMITYNNVLMEQRDGRNRVLVPRYELASLDEYAAKAYRAFGFEVSTINVSGVYDLGGAIRCIVNVTQRRPSHTRTSQTRWPGEIRCYDITPTTAQSGENDPDFSESCVENENTRVYPSLCRESS